MRRQALVFHFPAECILRHIPLWIVQQRTRHLPLCCLFAALHRNYINPNENNSNMRAIRFASRLLFSADAAADADAMVFCTHSHTHTLSIPLRKQDNGVPTRWNLSKLAVRVPIQVECISKFGADLKSRLFGFRWSTRRNCQHGWVLRQQCFKASVHFVDDDGNC